MIEALPGEIDVALAEVPAEAEWPDVLNVLDDVHAEGLAAIMRQGDIHDQPRVTLDRSKRPGRRWRATVEGWGDDDR